MLLAIECVAACVVLTLIILPALYQNPVKQIMSYPPSIRKRVESLPQYAGVIQKIERRHITVKICAVFLFAIVLGLTAYFSGAKTFSSAYFHVFMLFLAVNVYDVVVLDIGLFCHSKKLRIAGTEDMEQAYRDPWFHVIGGFKGLLIGAVTALLSACAVQILSAVQ